MTKKVPDIAELKLALKGASLRELIKRAGISQWRLARDMKLSYQTVYKWTRGQWGPSDENAMKVALYLGLIDPGGKDKLRLEKERAEIDRKIKAIEGNKIKER